MSKITQYVSLIQLGEGLQIRLLMAITVALIIMMGKIGRKERRIKMMQIASNTIRTMLELINTYHLGGNMEVISLHALLSLMKQHDNFTFTLPLMQS